MKIAIVGAGAMGRWFANFAKQSGWEVTVSDVDKRKAERVGEELGVRVARTNLEAAADADAVLVAVPIARTPEVIEELAGGLRRGALLMDIASAKSHVVATMEKLNTRKLELVSLHPLFGPGASTLRGKTFVSVGVSPRAKFREFKRHLVSLGAQVVEMDAEEHDRLMAVTQALTHFVLVAYVVALRSMKESRGAERLRAPMFAALLELGKATLAVNPELYGEVQVFNKYSQLARSMVMECCRKLDTAFVAHDVETVRELFREAPVFWTRKEIEAAYKRLYEKFEKGFT